MIARFDQEFEEFLGEKFKITIPVKKGRNLAIIIETAALNYRLRRMGLNTPEYFLEQSQRIINEKKAGNIMKGNKIVEKLKNEFQLKIILGEDKIKDTLYTDIKCIDPLCPNWLQ